MDYRIVLGVDEMDHRIGGPAVPRSKRASPCLLRSDLIDPTPMSSTNFRYALICMFEELECPQTPGI